jgi:hypothetical protein
MGRSVCGRNVSAITGIRAAQLNSICWSDGGLIHDTALRHSDEFLTRSHLFHQTPLARTSAMDLSHVHPIPNTSDYESSSLRYDGKPRSSTPRAVGGSATVETWRRPRGGVSGELPLLNFQSCLNINASIQVLPAFY